MPDKPVIFISATSDLRSARDLVGKILYSMGYEPVWQDIAATDGGELLDVLRRRLAPATMVLQLAGRRYGAEPPRPSSEFGRISYTQFEAREAERMGKKVVYALVNDDFPRDPAAQEPPELESLQAAYRERLVDANLLRHDQIASSQDLELSVRRIRDELEELRQQSDQRQRETDRRHRKVLRLGVAAVVGIVVLAVVALVALRRQATTDVVVNVKLDNQAGELAALRAAVADVRAAVSPKPISAGQQQPDPVPPDIVAKANILEERGDAEQRALGMIALQRHDEADRIIQQLKSKPGNPIDEAFQLLTMEGDNWYQANEPNKAIGPYGQAEALKPNDFNARNSLVAALISARRGDVAANLRRAIDTATETLKLAPSGSTEWAMTQNNLGVAWSDLPTGVKTENLKKAIAAHQAALTVFTKDESPADWAMMQNNLGAAWANIPTGDKAENLKKAFEAYGAALTVRTKDAYPADWACTQNNLGAAWANLPTGNKIENLEKAIAAYEAALTVRTKDAYPTGWAMTQYNLGNAWFNFPTGNKTENLKKAVAAYRASLTVFTKDAYPMEWARTQEYVALSWVDLPTGDKAENLKKAIAADEAALAVYTNDAYPTERSRTQAYLGLAWANLPTGDKAENLGKAIAAYEAALAASTKDADPAKWAMTQVILGDAWCKFPAGNKTENLENAIAAYDAALTVFTKDAYPAQWAMAQYGLGHARISLEGAKPGDR